jgi:ubiquinol-cytochrome c reductase cytochrome c1 subunit
MRIILGFIGGVFAVVLLISLFSNLATYFRAPPAELAQSVFHREPKEVHFSSDGPFGKFDKQQLQRGLQVRDLKGLGYNEAQIKNYAGSGQYWKTEVPSINPDTGEPSTRKALPSDNFPSPYANETAARAANNNALPPDLSLITKAREGGGAYVYSLLTGFQPQPAELLKRFPDAKTPPNLHYNPYFANLNLAMPPPLTTEGQVTYADGTKPTVDQMAKDVAAFLVWTAEPNLESRHAAGIAVAAFLLFASILGYFAYQDIWYGSKRAVRVTGPLEPKNQARTRRAKAKQGVAG